MNLEVSYLVVLCPILQYNIFIKDEERYGRIFIWVVQWMSRGGEKETTMEHVEENRVFMRRINRRLNVKEIFEKHLSKTKHQWMETFGKF